ncbi:MAG: Mur ligase family protein, partial [Verrucomicrobiota bacterium]
MLDLSGQQIAVLGAGGSGLAAAQLCLARGADVAVYDSGDSAKLSAASVRFSDLGIKLVVGESALEPSREFDLTVISPGIDLAWPIGRVFESCSRELIGEIELAFRDFDIPIIAITGTNGKTTTTELIATMLRGAGFDVAAAGNIGLAFSKVALDRPPLDYVVLEVSSFQLETIARFAPEMAVWMNFAPDHMDRYGSLDDYRAAKLRIFENLEDNALAITKLEDGLSVSSPQLTFSAFQDGGDYHYEGGDILRAEDGQRLSYSKCQLAGRHNA